MRFQAHAANCAPENQYAHGCCQQEEKGISFTWPDIGGTGQPLKHFDLLIQEMVEKDNLVFELQTGVVSPEKLLILLFKLLPDQLCEAWFNLELLLQLINYLQRDSLSQGDKGDKSQYTPRTISQQSYYFCTIPHFTGDC